MQWFSVVRALFIEYFGERINDIAAAVNGISIVFLLLAVGWYLRRFGNPLVDAARLWMFLVAGMTLIATARGFYYGLLPKFIVLDLLAFTAFLCFVFIGSIPQSFDDFRRVWFIVLVLSIPANLLAMSDLADFTTELTGGVRVARETISYRTHNSLDVVLLVGAFSFTLKKWERTVVLIGFCQVIAMQILYQKRLETAYYSCAALLCMWMWWIDTGAWRDRLRQYIRQGIVGLTVLFIVVLVVQGRHLLPQAIALIERSSGRSEDVEFKSGAVRYFFVDNERLQIVVDSLGTLSTVELWFGRGMGGGAEWTGFNMRMLDSAQSEEVWAANYLPDYGFFGRRAYEIGTATPILKGGIVFWLVIYSVYLLFLARLSLISQFLAGRLCIVIVGLQLPYAFFGGDFNITSVFQTGSYATCLGLGLSVFRDRGAVLSRFVPRGFKQTERVRGSARNAVFR
jgi:hypothetical protein